MEDIQKTLNSVILEYTTDDEEMIKHVQFVGGKKISFLFDMIDEEINVVINITGRSEYEYSYEGVNKKCTEDSFKNVLEKVLDALVGKRDKKIEFYASMETPSPGSVLTPGGGRKPAFEDTDDEIDEEDGEDNEVEEEGEDDIVISMKKSDLGPMETLDGGSDYQTMKLLREAPFEILKPTKLVEMQVSSIKKISDTMFISEAGANIILRAYKWNEERILNTFLTSGKEKVLRDVGLGTAGFEKKSVEDVDPNAEFECPSCFDDVPYKETLILDACSHRFCNDCWEQHLTYRIKDGLSKRIYCMGADCRCVVTENIVASYIKDPILKRKFDSKLLESFVEDNDQMKWCQSAPHCGNAVMVRVSNKTPLEIHCVCGTEPFCYVCLEEAHNPASCVMLTAWKKKCSDDSETLNWIKSNTRDCPHCNNAVEKSSGCNHMSCKCGGHFCWACGLAYKTDHQAHNCNRYLEKEDGGEKNETRASLERYLHYFNHYNAHHTSYKNQKKMEKKVDQKIRKMYHTRPNSAWVEVEWLKRGLNVLFDTRRALMHSYVFAYYLFDKTASKKKKLLKGCVKFRNNRHRVRAKNLFEDTQEQLELTTESLNKFLDMPLEKILLDSVKKEVMSASVLNEKRIHGLFDVVRDEMIIEGEFTLPSPRYIITAPTDGGSRMDVKAKKSYDEVPTPTPQPKPPQGGDAALQWAIQASLMEGGGGGGGNKETEDALLQQILMRSLQEK